MVRLLSFLLFLLLGPNPALSDNTKVTIQEWDVPWPSTRPRDPAVGPDGRVWFVGQVGHYVASFEPDTETFSRYDLEDYTGPHNVIVTGDSRVWYAGNLKAHIGELNRDTGAIKKYDMPHPRARDPHTLISDDQGHIWFTVQGGNFIGRLTIAEKVVDLIEVPTANARPYGIALDSNARPWIVELGSHKLATVDPKSLELREIELVRKETRPRRIAITSDDRVWYVDYAQGFLGRYDPKEGTVKEWLAPGGSQARPYAMAADDKDRLWFVEVGPQPNRLVGFDPALDNFFSITPIPSGGGAVRHMVFHPPTRVIWFGTDTNTLGRAHIPE
ncbi:MAG: hypothetical protein QNI91_14855 [Arenicellales bacterium]|nr:hypothetical protein [Arenicellales bacterium]